MTTAESMLAALAELCVPWSAKLDLDTRISRALQCLHEQLGYEHSMLLVPAVLELLGRHAWALPVSIERRLPTLQIHAEPSRVVGSTPSFTPGQEVAS